MRVSTMRAVIALLMLLSAITPSSASRYQLELVRTQDEIRLVAADRQVLFQFALKDALPLDAGTWPADLAPDRYLDMVERYVREMGNRLNFPDARMECEAVRALRQSRFSRPFTVISSSEPGGLGSPSLRVVLELQGDAPDRLLTSASYGLFPSEPFQCKPGPEGQTYSEESAQHAARSFFPTMVAENRPHLTRIAFKTFGGNAPPFFWRFDGLPTSWLIGADGWAYRADEHYLVDAAGRFELTGPVQVERLKTAPPRPELSTTLPDAATAACMVKALPTFDSMGALGVPWGAGVEELWRRRPDLDWPGLSEARERNGDLMWAVNVIFESIGGELRYLQGSRFYALLKDQRFVGVLIRLSEPEYVACCEVFRDRFKTPEASPSYSTLLVNHHWRQGRTVISLVHESGLEFKHGLFLFDAELFPGQTSPGSL